MTTLITPPRRRGFEYLDAPGVDPRLVRRSLADVALANALFGGTRAVLLELGEVLPELSATSTLLDVGSGVGDIAARAHDIFFFNDTATTEIYTLSLHDALPI